MRKAKLLSVALLLGGLVLTGCGNANTPTDPISPVDPGGDPEAEKYTINVSAPAGVDYTLNKTKAAKGEDIILTITRLETGVTISSVTMNSTTLSSTDGTTYNFKMPNQSAFIKINVDVSGEVVLTGEVAANLVKEGEIYVARSVSVPLSSSPRAFFSYKVGASSILDSKELDEDKCFADITFTSGSSSTQKFSIARGFTYDFYYDPTAPLPCYVKRVSVDYLPNTIGGLEALFSGSYRSESTVNYDDLKGYTYRVTDRSNPDNTFKTQETMKMYEGNVMYNVVEDVIDDKTYYQYKHFDETNMTYEIVDTFPTNRGNNEKYRINSASNAVSARYDVASDSEYDFKNNNDPGEVSGRGTYPIRAVKHSLTHGAHYGKVFEDEWSQSYRWGFPESGYSINIESEQDSETKVITTNVDSYIVYDQSASTYVTERHEAIVYDLTLTFTGDGKPLSIDYVLNSYKLADWDMTNNVPNAGAEPTLVKKIEGSFEYGEPYSGAPTFDKSKYFISDITNIRFYNSATAKPDDGNSYLHYLDHVNLYKMGDNDSIPYLKEFTYSPLTALDAWQFGPTSSSNTSVIGKGQGDYSYSMSCVGIGDATVTFGNYTKNSPTFNLNINVSATAKFRSVYLYSRWGEQPSVGVETSDSAKVMAGEVTYFKVAVTPDKAPVVYNAQSEDPSLLTISSTGEKLGIDCTGASSITENKTVRVKITSDWFDDPTKYVMFTFYIIPSSANPTGTTWNMEGYEEHASVTFTSEAYIGETSSKFTNPLIGHIIDDGYQDDGTSSSSLSVDFYYEYKGGEILAKVTRISITPNTSGWATDPSYWDIAFYADFTTGKLGVYLAEWEYDSDIEDRVWSPIYGEAEDGEPYSYTPFVKQA